MKKIRIGIVGLWRGKTFLKLFDKSFEETVVTAVCETDPKRIEESKDDLNDSIEVFDDYDKFLESGKLDAVMLANYFHEHASYAIKAMEKGIAVLSETTAAPTLGECVDLVETCERTGAKYMLAANCLYFPALHAMKAKYESGKYGVLFNGNAEYIHGSVPNAENTNIPGKEAIIDEENLHWRKTLPMNYYNMHTLGPLMYATNSVPVKVMYKGTHNLEHNYACGKMSDCPTAMVITEMDNGAVFNTTGCANQVPPTKWYRLGFSQGNMETVRYEDAQNTLLEGYENEKGEQEFTSTRYTWTTSGAIEPENYEKGAAEKSGHGGIDYFVAYHFIQYMLGKSEPFFNVYRSVALSAAGIIGWYSALSDGKEYKIPDFTKKEDRDKVRGDYRLPIAKDYKDLTLPCRLEDKDKFDGFDF